MISHPVRKSKYSYLLLTWLLVTLGLAGCIKEKKELNQHEMAPHERFFQHIKSLCGQTFLGNRTLAREDRRELLSGDETLLLHFFQCNNDVIRTAFHIGQPDGTTWDRSRVWSLGLEGDFLSILHEHRNENGQFKTISGYGGDTVAAGTDEQQLFIFTERTGEQGEILGWRVEVIPQQRFSYGTMKDGEWTWRVDFDLNHMVSNPPLPWGAK